MHMQLESVADESSKMFLEKVVRMHLPLKSVVMHVCSECNSVNVNRMEEFKVAVDAIDHLGCFGEVKLTEWIRGSKRPWMSTKAHNYKARLSLSWGVERCDRAVPLVHSRCLPAKSSNNQ